MTSGDSLRVAAILTATAIPGKRCTSGKRNVNLLPGAINIPLKQLDQETTRALDRARPVVAYCYDHQ